MENNNYNSGYLTLHPQWGERAPNSKLTSNSSSITSTANKIWWKNNYYNSVYPTLYSQWGEGAHNPKFDIGFEFYVSENPCKQNLGIHKLKLEFWPSGSGLYSTVRHFKLYLLLFDRRELKKVKSHLRDFQISKRFRANPNLQKIYENRLVTRAEPLLKASLARVVFSRPRILEKLYDFGVEIASETVAVPDY